MRTRIIIGSALALAAIAAAVVAWRYWQTQQKATK